MGISNTFLIKSGKLLFKRLFDDFSDTQFAVIDPNIEEAIGI